MAGESALSRWSHRKHAARFRNEFDNGRADHKAFADPNVGDTRTDPASVAFDPSARETLTSETSPTSGDETAAPPTVPVEDLDLNSDFASYLRAGVDPLARRAALRKLWRLDPAFAELDGMVEYGEDYNARVTDAVVETAFRVTDGISQLLADKDLFGPGTKEVGGAATAAAAGRASADDDGLSQAWHSDMPQHLQENHLQQQDVQQQHAGASPRRRDDTG